MNSEPKSNDAGALDRPAEDPRHQVAVEVAIVAGVFSAIVAAVLLFDFASRGPDDPLETAEYQTLRQKLAQQPNSEAIKEEIRRLDVTLRESYFRRRRFAENGAWLLLTGIAVLVASAKAARALRPELPMPQPPDAARDPEIRSTAIARVGVAVLGLAVLGAAGILVSSLTSRLPQSAEQVAVVEQPTPQVATTNPSVRPTPPEVAPQPEAPPTSVVSPLTPEAEAEWMTNWPCFRGPGGLGISHHKNVPTAWDATTEEGILWKTPVPLPGNNSPVVWGDRVFLSGATEEEQQVYCFDAASGKLLWQQEVPADPNAPDEPLEVMDATGFAAPTTATDGQHIFAMFATGDVAAFDFEGKPTWTRHLGRPKNSYGHAASLATYGNLLLIQFDQGSAKDDLSKVLALSGETGDTVWEMPRSVANSWPSPVVIRLEDGSHQLITASDPWVIAYDPADGREIWRSKSLEGDVGPSPVFAGGVVYVANEFPGLVAIRVDDSTKGDVTESHVLWLGEDGVPDTASPLATEEFVFVTASYGILTCYDAKTGEVLWEEEFDDSTFTSSPSLAGDLLYLFAEEGKTWIVKPTRDGCERIGEAELGEKCVTSPAFQDGRLYIRGTEHLFAIGAAAATAESETPDLPVSQ